MNALFYFAIVTFAMGALAFWFVYEGKRLRVAATLAFFAICTLNFFAGFELMGVAKPRWLEFKDIAGSRVVGLYWIEDVAIYLTMLVDGKPVLYQLPWVMNDAEKLQKHKSDMREDNGSTWNYKEGESESDDVIENKELVLPEKPDFSDR